MRRYRRRSASRRRLHTHHATNTLNASICPMACPATVGARWPERHLVCQRCWSRFHSTCFGREKSRSFMLPIESPNEHLGRSDDSGTNLSEMRIRMRFRSPFEGVSTLFGIWATKRYKVLRRVDEDAHSEMFRFYVRPTIPTVRLGWLNLMALFCSLMWNDISPMPTRIMKLI